MENSATREIASLARELRSMVKNYSQKEIRLGRLMAQRGKFLFLQNSETSTPELDQETYNSKLLQIAGEISALTAEMSILVPELESKSLEVQAHLILAGELDDFVHNAILTTA